MKNSKNVSMHPMHIHETSDYSLFNNLKGNRKLNKLHVNSLIESMTEKYLYTILVVNEKYDIIDGQHRFEAIKKLGLPVRYIICTGYSLNDIQRYNAENKSWKAEDFLNGYCDLGKPEYIKYKMYKDTYGLQHNVCMYLLGGSTKANVIGFRNGTFKIIDYDKAVKNIEKVFMTAEFYKNGFKRRSYIYALIQLFKNPSFEFTEFLQKLRLQPTALVDLPTTTGYVELIEEIYNYRRRDKVGLKFFNENT